MIDNAADDWRIAMTWQRMMQVFVLHFVFCILYFVFCILYFVFCILLCASVGCKGSPGNNHLREKSNI